VEKRLVHSSRKIAMRSIRWLLFIALLSLVIGGLSLDAQETNRAAVVVRFDNERSISQCISFDEEKINGYQLLERSGLALDAQFESLGGIICGIEDTGCAAGDCLCACRGGGDCVYWSYWLQADDVWRYAQIGATSHSVVNGDVEGWSWGPGSLTDAIEPPLMSFDEICTNSVESQNEAPITQDRDRPSYNTLIVFGGIVIVLILIFLNVRRRGSS
jgi:hypothetical protein